MYSQDEEGYLENFIVIEEVDGEGNILIEALTNEEEDQNNGNEVINLKFSIKSLPFFMHKSYSALFQFFHWGH